MSNKKDIDITPGPIMQGNTAIQQSSHSSIAQADRLIELAMSQDVSMEKLEKLLELKERYEKEEARKAYVAAMAEFKSEGVVIEKDRLVNYEHSNGDGETRYRHASLGNVIGVATPFLAKHGLSHKWVSRRVEARIEVKCVITHREGHSEETDWWPGPLDTSGKKNPLQQAASTVTYLERYTFLMITGLAVVDQDDDGTDGGEMPGPERITEDQANKIHAMITENELSMDIFMRWLKQSIKCKAIADIPSSYFDAVMGKIEKTIKAKGVK